MSTPTPQVTPVKTDEFDLTTGESLGRHYNPTEDYMVWTNREYRPQGNSRVKQKWRTLWHQLNKRFGY